MLSSELPISLEEQIVFMKQYATFRQKRRMRDFLKYAGYFRASRYGKYLLSCAGTLGDQPKQDMLFQLYEFDVKLRGNIRREAFVESWILILCFSGNPWYNERR